MRAPGRWAAGRLRLPLVAGVATAAAALGLLEHRDRLLDAFGPPDVVAREIHAPGTAAGAAFHHSALDRLLARYVDDRGAVDYRSLRADAAALDAYIERLADAPFADLGRDAKLALLINAYNAFTLRLILDHWPVESIRDIPAPQRWSAQRWRVAGRVLSLDQIEHEEIRPKFREPRIHFALVCAARGCPPLRREAYVAPRIEAQLEDQARRVHADPRWFRWDEAAQTAYLTPLYRWYRGDFEQAAGSVAAYVGRYAPDVRVRADTGAPLAHRWLPYDWALNAPRAGR